MNSHMVDVEILDASTGEQREALARNPHFLPVEVLRDGDILVIDAEGFGPYILCINGYVQAVDYHYKHYHDISEITTQWEREAEYRKAGGRR